LKNHKKNEKDANRQEKKFFPFVLAPELETISFLFFCSVPFCQNQRAAKKQKSKKKTSARRKQCQRQTVLKKLIIFD
jgi:hypothetical protein